MIQDEDNGGFRGHMFRAHHLNSAEVDAQGESQKTDDDAASHGRVNGKW
jgi:hypothetical protein